jgi:hypothetical protein
MTRNQHPDRRHIRYRDPGQLLVRLVRQAGSNERILPALVVDQCHGGLCLVVVGEPPRKGERFWFQENEVIRTGLTLRHHRILDEGIHRLGFELTDEVARIQP